MGCCVNLVFINIMKVLTEKIYILLLKNEWGGGGTIMQCNGWDRAWTECLADPEPNGPATVLARSSLEKKGNEQMPWMQTPGRQFRQGLTFQGKVYNQVEPKKSAYLNWFTHLFIQTCPECPAQGQALSIRAEDIIVSKTHTGSWISRSQVAEIEH